MKYTKLMNLWETYTKFSALSTLSIEKPRPCTVCGKPFTGEKNFCSAECHKKNKEQK